MKAIFVNSVHPDTKHVASMRLSRFAIAMAARGHKIVLLTPTLGARPSGTARPPQAYGPVMASHDWAKPLLVDYVPTRSRMLDAIRQQTIPSALRRPLTAFLFAARGGVHNDRVAGSRPFWPALTDGFKPDLIWSTFGDTGNLMIGQALALRSQAPWLMDIKDNWEGFLRPGLRSMMARRFSNASGFTANADYHSDIAKRWHLQKSCVVYSGVVDEMMAAKDAHRRRDAFSIVQVGSVRDEQKFGEFLGGLDKWARSKPPSDQQLIEFRYAGASADLVKRALGNARVSFKSVVDPYLSVADLGHLCQGAAVTSYLWSPNTFHHKLLELLACRRPVLAFPGEHEESRRLAREVHGELLIASTEGELAATFESLFQRWKSGSEPASQVDVSALTWDAMAVRLDAFMQSIIADRHGPPGARPQPQIRG